MRLRFRLLIVILMAFFKKPLKIADESRIGFWVLPTDCVVRYMGNDRYLGFLDLGRIDFLFRCTLWKIVVSRNWQPHIITAHIRYKLALRIFSSFDLRTRIIKADRKFFLFEHIFQQHGKTVATAFSKCIFFDKNGIVSTNIIFHALRQQNLFEDCMEKARIINDIDELLRKTNF